MSDTLTGLCDTLDRGWQRACVLTSGKTTRQTMGETSNNTGDLREQVKALTESITRFEACTDRLSLLLDQAGLLARNGPSEAANQEAGFKSRDHVQLIGCVLRVNCRDIGLSKRQTVLLEILIRHALTGDSGFLSTQKVIEEIKKNFAAVWPRPIAEDIHEVVYRIRRKLGLERDLLESSAAKGGGLRISTPRENIELKSPWSANPCLNPASSKAITPPGGDADEESSIYRLMTSETLRPVVLKPMPKT